jgi:tetratricopeptide (TPR) repeat protein
MKKLLAVILSLALLLIVLTFYFAPLQGELNYFYGLDRNEILKSLSGLGIANIESFLEIGNNFMNALIGDLFSILKGVASLLILVFIGMFLFRIYRERGLVILPFEVSISEEKYNSKAISDLLAAELQRIRQIHSFNYEEIVPLGTENSALLTLTPGSESLKQIAKLGPVRAGSASSTFDQLMLTVKKIFPRAGRIRVITGSMQKYGSMITLVAHMENPDVRVWEVRRRFKSQDQGQDEHIPSLVRDLAFKISHDLSTDVSAKTWQGLKHFTEALQNYREYTLTKDNKDLVRARKNVLKASRIERSYGETFGLLYNLGIAYLNKLDYEIAEKLFFQATLVKEDADAFVGLGTVYGLQERYYEAFDAFNRATDLDPQNANAWNNKSAALHNLGKYKEAIECDEKAIRLSPQNAEAWHKKGMALFNQDRFEEAVECDNRAIALNPRFAEAWYSKGMSLIKADKYEEAIICLSEAINQNLGDLEAWYKMGAALLSLGNYKQAIESFDKAIELDPEDDRCWNNKGVAMLNLDRNKEAMECFDRAMALNPELALASYNKGVALLKSDNSDKAVEYFDRAIEINPELAEAWYSKGLFAISSG